jgi:hypothetical protein
MDPAGGGAFLAKIGNLTAALEHSVLTLQEREGHGARKGAERKLPLSLSDWRRTLNWFMQTANRSNEKQARS